MERDVDLTRADLRHLGIEPTPLLDLTAMAPEGMQLFGKAEWHLPTGSVKDRIAAAMIHRARMAGELSADTRLIEPSSGNTGIALARLAGMQQLPLTVVAPDDISTERRDIIRTYGAELLLTPGQEGSNGAVRRAEELASNGDYLMLHQYENPANPGAHEISTGPEILEQLAALDIDRLDAFVATLGTGGTITGVGRAIRRRYPRAAIVAAEPPSGELIAGLRSMDDGYIPPIFDPSVLTSKILVRTGDSIATTRRILGATGWMVGPSSGAAVHAALKVANRMEPGAVIVTVLADAAWKYLSTGIFTGSVDEASRRVLGTTMW